jgi:glyoxylase-like metal-dependent hydrolase (beta-lactamase superfamily II)
VWRKHVLVDSLKKLLDYPFEWVLAGHGDRVCLPAEEMRAQLQALVGRRHPGHVTS